MLDFYSKNYDNQVILGDINLETSNPSIASFMNNQNLFYLVKSNTCFKGEYSCTDLISTNRKHSFKNTCSFKTGLSYQYHSEAVVQRCSVKKVFLEISQNSQENVCARDSFLIKLQA